MLCKFFTRKETDDLSYIESKTIVTICLKICDIVLKSVMGYCYIFQACWISSVNCLKDVMLAYIAFLGVLCDKMLSYPTCVFASCASVMIIVTICVTIIEVFS